MGYRLANGEPNRRPGTTTTAEHAECTAPPDPHDAVVECGFDDQKPVEPDSPTQGLGVDRNKTRRAGERNAPGTAQGDAARGPTGSSAPPGGHALHGLTDAESAKEQGFSRRLLFYAVRVDAEAPELGEAVARGEVTVTDADAIRQRPENERRSALEAVRGGEVKTLQRYFGQPRRVVRFAAPLAARAERCIARVGLEMTFQEFAQQVVLMAIEKMEDAAEEEGG